MSGAWKWFYEIMLLVGVGASWTFVGWYTARFRWWANELGRHVISFSACVGAFYTWYAVSVFWPGIPGRNLVRLFLFLAMTFVVVWRLVVFVRVARKIPEKESV